MRSEAPVVATLLCCAAVALAAAAADRPGAFAIGVLRRDAIVIPFATYDGKRWRTAWPSPRNDIDIPIDFRSVPRRWWGPTSPLDTWDVWTGANAPRAIHVLRPDWFHAHCFHQVGLRTDYQSSEPPPPPEAQPYPKDGLAVAPRQPVELVERISGTLQAPLPLIEAFNRAERTAVEHFGRRYLIAEKKRESGDVKVEASYAFGDPAATRVYYYEASREYLSAETSECSTLTFGGGFFARDGGGALRLLRFDAAVARCDRYGLRYMLPLGAMRLAGRLFWIAQWSGWDYEAYEVVEIKAKTAESVVSAWGGGC